jgi:hypothetical protein
MTDFTILRKEVKKDSSGKDEVFVQFEVYDDDEGIIPYARWFSGKQAQDIIADENNLTGIIQKMIKPLVADKKVKNIRLKAGLPEE